MLSDRFDEALVFASSLHRDQTRNVSGTPYVAHVLSVAALTLEYFGDEDCAIAALLHDAPEYEEGSDIARTVKTRFGARVADIVLECSDRASKPDQPWLARKSDFVTSIATKSPDAALVISCSTLDDSTVLLEEIVADGLSAFSRYRAPRRDVLWYYREMAEVLQNRAPGPLTARLKKTVAQIEYWVNVAD